MFQKLDEGEGINDVARQHRVPHQTLSDRWRKHNALQSKIPGHVGRPPHLNSGQVTLLVNRIKEASHRGAMITSSVVANFANAILEEANFRHGILTGEGFGKHFLEQHPELPRGVASKGETKNSFRPDLEGSIRFIDNLANASTEILEAINRGYVISIDETGIELSITKSKTVVYKEFGSRRPPDHVIAGLNDKITGHHLTLVSAVSPLRTLMRAIEVPYFIVTPHDDLRNVVWGAGLDEEVLEVACSESGWMNEEIFATYARSLSTKIRSQVPMTKVVVVFIDVASSHYSHDALNVFKEANIEVFFLPAGATDDIQPPDTHVFGRMKRPFRHKIKRYVEDELEGDARNMSSHISLRTLIQLLKEPYTSATTPTIISRAFAEDCLSPLNLDGLRHKLGVDSTTQGGRGLERKVFVLPDLSPLESYLSDDQRAVFLEDFHHPSYGRMLSSLAVAWLQVGGEKLLVPFREFLTYCRDHQEDLDPPVYDPKPELMFSGYHVVVGGPLHSVITKDKSQTKVTLMSGEHGTSADFLARASQVAEEKRRKTEDREYKVRMKISAQDHLLAELSDPSRRIHVTQDELEFLRAPDLYNIALQRVPKDASTDFYPKRSMKKEDLVFLASGASCVCEGSTLPWGETMVECEACSKWYHLSCLTREDSSEETEGDLRCPECEATLRIKQISDDVSEGAGYVDEESS